MKIKPGIISSRTLVLAAIIIIGIFLRSYQFHNWLDFGSDQVNDAIRVGAVIEGAAPWPLLGPDMSNSGEDTRESRFRLGPMFYYFEIVSAGVFGNEPDSMAVPDLIFSIFSIPLFYVFLKRYFSVKTSLALVGLYSISYYLLRFSHSAWNPNSIPFFTILFLLGLHKFLCKGKKIGWLWAAALAISIGVGVQLHAITLALFPLTTLAVFIALARKNELAISRWAFVIFLALALNVGQIVYEIKTDFSNTKTFFNSIGAEEGTGIFSNAAKNISCHIQANVHILTSVTPDECDFMVTRPGKENKIFLNLLNPSYLVLLLLAVAFSSLGYWSLFYLFRNERDPEKKYFLGLIIIYAFLSFLVMLPIIDAHFRYFIHIFFIPFLFLGLMPGALPGKLSSKYLSAIILLVVVAANLNSIFSEAKKYHTHTKSGPNAIVLGEIEAMADYLMKESGSEKSIHLITKRRLANFHKPLDYIMDKKGYRLLRMKEGDMVSNEPVFFLDHGVDRPGSEPEVENYSIDSVKNFGQTAIYGLRFIPVNNENH